MRPRKLDGKGLRLLAVSFVLLILAALAEARASTWLAMHVQFVRLERDFIVVRESGSKANLCFRRETLGPPMVNNIWKYAKDRPKTFSLPVDSAVHPKVARGGKEKC